MATHFEAIAGQSSPSRVIGIVGLVHALSHLFMLVLPPIFLLLQDEFTVSLVELGLVLAGFNLVTTVTQYPFGILVDRFGSVLCLKLGLTLSLISLAICALAPNFWIFAAGYLLCGLANSVYHPGDFQLLNTQVPRERRAFAFSVHSFTGNLGFALAPAMVTPLAYAFGWRISFIAVIAVGCTGLLALWFLEDVHVRDTPTSSKPKAPISAILTRQLWLQLLIFTLYSFITGGIQGFSIVAAMETFDYGLELATAALSAYLLCGTLGIVAGGVTLKLVDSERFGFGLGVLQGIVGWLLVWSGLGGAIGYMAGMLIVGFAMGFVLPARDMLVARTAQPGLQGQTYGFVTTGINIGLLIAPVVAGYLINNGYNHGFYAAMMTILVANLVAGTIRLKPRYS